MRSPLARRMTRWFSFFTYSGPSASTINFTLGGCLASDTASRRADQSICGSAWPDCSVSTSGAMSPLICSPAA